MITHFSRLKNGSVMLLMHVTLSLFSFSFLPLFLHKNGYPYYMLVLPSVLFAGFGVLFISLIRTYNLRTFICLGYACFALMALSLLFHVHYYSIFIYSVLLALALVFYWIPINYVFFHTSSASTNALDSSVYMASSGFLSIFVPLAGALVIKHGGFSWLFGLTALLYLIPLFFAARKISPVTITLPLRDGIREFKRLRTITFLEGSLQFFVATVIPIYTLLFLNTELQFGSFLGYLGLLGSIAAFLFSYHSDKTQKRLGYLTFLFAAMALCSLLFIFIDAVSSWLIVVGLFTMLSTISSPLRLAVSLDVKKADLHFWKVRELFLNIGRFVTLCIAMIFFYLQLYWPVFVMFGMIYLLYPLLVKHKLKEVK